MTGVGDQSLSDAIANALFRLSQRQEVIRGTWTDGDKFNFYHLQQAAIEKYTFDKDGEPIMATPQDEIVPIEITAHIEIKKKKAKKVLK